MMEEMTESNGFQQPSFSFLLEEMRKADVRMKILYGQKRKRKKKKGKMFHFIVIKA